jgi:hypothetical protein
VKARNNLHTSFDMVSTSGGTYTGCGGSLYTSAASSDSTMPLLIEFAQKILSLLEQKCGAMTSGDKFLTSTKILTK